jgi:hypothetical protein
LDLVAHLLHRDVAGIWQAVRRRDGVARKEDHGEAGFFDETAGESVVGTAVCEDFAGGAVCFQHHAAEAGGLDARDGAADVGECQRDIAGSVGFAGSSDGGDVGEGEGVGCCVDD